MKDHRNPELSCQDHLSRRELLHRSAAIGAALGTASLSQTYAAIKNTEKNTPQRKPIYKSLKFGMIQEDLSILDKFKLVQDIGYDGVELDSPGGQDKKESLEASRMTGLPIHGVVDSRHWNVRATESDPQRRQQCLNDLLTAIEECHYCGGSSVLFVPGHGNDGPESDIILRAIEVIQPDVGTAGGILEVSKKIASMADAYFIMVAPHNPCGPIQTAATMQVDACMPNFLIQEFVPYTASPREPDRVFSLLKETYEMEYWKRKDGFVEVFDRPGLGIELKDDKLP